MIKGLHLTPATEEAIKAALQAVRRAEAVYVPGRDSADLIEIPQLAFARAVLAAIAEEEARTR